MIWEDPQNPGYRQILRSAGSASANELWGWSKEQGFYKVEKFVCLETSWQAIMTEIASHENAFRVCFEI